jgi:glutaredoxin 2
MALGYLHQNYESQVVPYDDQATPVSLIGQKMLPIMAFNGTPMKESLDIIAKLDTENKLQVKNDLTSVENFIKAVNNPVHSLAMPYWIWTKEFTPSAREYFVKQKEAKRGPFRELVRKAETFQQELTPLFHSLKEKLSPYFESDRIRIQDIMISAHLWGLYVVPEFQFPYEIHSYLQKVKNECRFNYHQDYWS